MERFLYKRGFKTRMVLYLGLAMVLLLASLISVIIANYFLATFLLVVAVAALYFLLKNRKLSLATDINRKQIQQVEYKEAIQGVSRAMFLVHFEEGNKSYLKQLQLPPSSPKGQMIVQSALMMMKDEGLIHQ